MGITREEQDEFAVAAIESGRFQSQIAPGVKRTRKGDVVFEADEAPRAGTMPETLARLKPAFEPEGGTVTAGNASGSNDGAAFFMLAEATVAGHAGLKPPARPVS